MNHKYSTIVLLVLFVLVMLVPAVAFWDEHNGNSVTLRGNVGINTATPVYLLDVNGTVRFSDLASGNISNATFPQSSVSCSGVTFPQAFTLSTQGVFTGVSCVTANGSGGGNSSGQSETNIFLSNSNAVFLNTSYPSFFSVVLAAQNLSNLSYLNNKITSACQNISGATSNLCTITDTDTHITTLPADNLTNVSTLSYKINVSCGNVTGATSNLCTIIDTDTDTHATSMNAFNITPAGNNTFGLANFTMMGNLQVQGLFTSNITNSTFPGSSATCPTNNTAQNFSVGTNGLVTSQCVPNINATSSAGSSPSTYPAPNITQGNNGTFGFGNYTVLQSFTVFGTLNALFDLNNATNWTAGYNKTRSSYENLTEGNRYLENKTICYSANFSGILALTNIPYISNASAWGNDSANITADKNVWVRTGWFNASRLNGTNVSGALFPINNTICSGQIVNSINFTGTGLAMIGCVTDQTGAAANATAATGWTSYSGFVGLSNISENVSIGSSSNPGKAKLNVSGNISIAGNGYGIIYSDGTYQNTSPGWIDGGMRVRLDNFNDNVSVGSDNAPGFAKLNVSGNISLPNLGTGIIFNSGTLASAKVQTLAANYYNFQPSYMTRIHSFARPLGVTGTTMTGVGMSNPTQTGVTTASNRVDRYYINYTQGAVNASSGITLASLTQRNYYPIISTTLATGFNVSQQRLWFALEQNALDTNDGAGGGNNFFGIRHSTNQSDKNFWYCCSSDGTTNSCTNTTVAVNASAVGNQVFNMTLDLSRENTGLCIINNVVTSKTTNLPTNVTLALRETVTTLLNISRALPIAYVYVESY